MQPKNKMFFCNGSQTHRYKSIVFFRSVINDVWRRKCISMHFVYRRILKIVFFLFCFFFIRLHYGAKQNCILVLCLLNSNFQSLDKTATLVLITHTHTHVFFLLLQLMLPFFFYLLLAKFNFCLSSVLCVCVW